MDPVQTISATELPNEVLGLIMDAAEEEEGEPRENLHALRQVCRLFANLALPRMYTRLQLLAKRGAASVARDTEFLLQCTTAASFVRELRILGMEEGIWGDPATECILRADAVTGLCTAAPLAERLVLSRILWEPEGASGPQPEFPHITQVDLLDVVLIRPCAFPDNILQRLTHVHNVRITYAPWSMYDDEIINALATRTPSPPSLRFGPSVPFPADAIENSIIASHDSLRELILEITPLNQAPLYLGLPAVVPIRLASLLQKFELVMPLFAFPTEDHANYTWMYARDTLHTILPELPELTLVFECSLRRNEEPYPRLARLPMHELRSVLDYLSSISKVVLVLQAYESCPAPSWARVAAISTEWREVLQRDNLSTEVRRTTDGSGPFSVLTLQDGEETDSHELEYLWWNPDQ